MKKLNLKTLIKECVTEVFNEDKVDTHGYDQKNHMELRKAANSRDAARFVYHTDKFNDNNAEFENFDQFKQSHKYQDWLKQNLPKIKNVDAKFKRMSEARKMKESTLKESNIQDPTHEEMINYLISQYGEEARDEAEVAIYWFADHYHGGQSSNLYSVLSTSVYSPGPNSTIEKEGEFAEMLYNSLESEFGGKQ